MTTVREDPARDAAAPGDLPAGFAVGEYRIEKVLGRGGMGAVYAAQQPEIGARVAIKVLATDLSRDPRLVKRFVDEARAVNKIRHPSIIDIFSFGRLEDGREYFVMEYLEGETLGARLGRGPVPVTEARRLLLQICEGLEAAHQEQIVHRDLKPENVWIATPKHGQPYAKILDFGIAKLIEDRDAAMATESGVAMGTAHFMSPEQCRGEPVDARADIYAMGVLLYHMWTGRFPFQGASFVAVATQQITATPTPPSAHRPVPARLERLIMSCLEKDPARRPQSAKALGRELDEALAEAMPGETLPAGPAAAQMTGARRVPAARRGLIGAAVVVAVLGGVGTWLALRPRREATPPPAPAIGAPVRPAPQPTAEPLPPPAPAAAVQPKPAPMPARPRERRAPAPPAERPASKLDERGFLKENPFR